MKLDVTLELGGYMADSARTILVAPVSPEAELLERDGWTLRTHNRSLVVHHEHTVVIREGAPLVLTAA